MARPRGAAGSASGLLAASGATAVAGVDAWYSVNSPILIRAHCVEPVSNLDFTAFHLCDDSKTPL